MTGAARPGDDGGTRSGLYPCDQYLFADLLTEAERVVLGRLRGVLRRSQPLEDGETVRTARSLAGALGLRVLDLAQRSSGRLSVLTVTAGRPTGPVALAGLTRTGTRGLLRRGGGRGRRGRCGGSGSRSRRGRSRGLLTYGRAGTGTGTHTRPLPVTG